MTSFRRKILAIDSSDVADWLCAPWPIFSQADSSSDPLTRTMNDAIMSSLPFGDVNVLVVTDVHSWIGGHLHPLDTESSGSSLPMNVDYGDVLSFHSRLQDITLSQKQDFFFVMNGDIVDGTGLSVRVPPTELTPLLQAMPWNAVNMGNHELYHNGTNA